MKRWCLLTGAHQGKDTSGGHDAAMMPQVMNRLKLSLRSELRGWIDIHIYIFGYVHINIYVCVCVKITCNKIQTYMVQCWVVHPPLPPHLWYPPPCGVGGGGGAGGGSTSSNHNSSTT